MAIAREWPHMLMPRPPKMPTTPSPLPLALRAALALALAVAATTSHADAAADDKSQALKEFVAAYRLAELWPQMAPRIARDSLPRLEDATHADIDADVFPTPASAVAAHAQVALLLAQGRKELEAALQTFDADELAAWTAYKIYARYFETEEIRQINAFFGSATGRKLTAAAPDILVESRKPGAGDVMARHFSAPELAEITTFWNSPVGVKMNRTAEQVREDMHAHFIERSEASVQTVARGLATRAEAAAAASAPAK
jgi:hypothetical protein